MHYITNQSFMLENAKICLDFFQDCLLIYYMKSSINYTFDSFRSYITVGQQLWCKIWDKHTAGLKQFLSSVCGLRDKQACRQTLCEDTRSSASLPYLLKHSQSMMNGGLFQFSSSMHILKKGCKILLGSEFTTFWFDSHARGLVRDEVFLIALGYFVWVGGLTHHAREDVQRVAEIFFFFLKATVFLQQAVDGFKQQWVTEEKKSKPAPITFALSGWWFVWFKDVFTYSCRFCTLWSGFEWCTGKQAPDNVCAVKCTDVGYLQRNRAQPRLKKEANRGD